MLHPWWVRHKGRLGYELKKLKEAGYSYSMKREWFKNGGSGLIQLRKESGTHAGLELEVYFPDTYPYSRFEVVAPELNLDFHQNPFTKGLCLLGRAPEQWFSSDTVASILNKQLNTTIRAGQTDDPDAVANKEDDQAEPFSDMYSYLPGYLILSDSSFEIPAQTLHGTMLIGLKGSLNKGFTGIILEVYDEKGNTLAQANSKIIDSHSTALGFKEKINARWVRLPQPIKTNTPEAFYKEVRAHLPEKFPYLTKKKFNGKSVEILAAYFPEEVSRRQKGWGWTFCVRASKFKRAQNVRSPWAMIRPGYIGHDDVMCRTSFLSEMKSKTVALFGLGCLGAPSAIELARCGIGRLRVLDFDYADPCTLSRWPFGLSAAGKLKTEIIASFITANYPYTNVEFEQVRLGTISTERPKAKNDYEILEKILAGVDLAYDATADFNLQHLLSDLTNELNIPYIAISATPGIWGGQISRILPNKTSGCWHCINAHQTDFWKGKMTATTIPLPFADTAATGRIQPKGCGSPTFTGAGFDANVISTCGVRLTVSTLTEEEENGYPMMDWDVAIVNLRNEDGSATLPNWQTYKLSPHTKCPCQK